MFTKTKNYKGKSIFFLYSLRSEVMSVAGEVVAAPVPVRKSYYSQITQGQSLTDFDQLFQEQDVYDLNERLLR